MILTLMNFRARSRGEVRRERLGNFARPIDGSAFSRFLSSAVLL